MDVLPLFLLNIYGAVCMSKVYFNAVLVDAKALLFNVPLERNGPPLKLSCCIPQAIL